MFINAACYCLTILEAYCSGADLCVLFLIDFGIIEALLGGEIIVAELKAEDFFELTPSVVAGAGESFLLADLHLF